MPSELIRFSSRVTWLNASVRPLHIWVETVLHLDAQGQPISVCFNSVPDAAFIQALRSLRCLSIWEFTSEERGWVEPGLYEVRVNDDDDYDREVLTCDYVRWGPFSNLPNSSAPASAPPSREP
jgi:hypothetical protein